MESIRQPLTSRQYESASNSCFNLNALLDHLELKGKDRAIVSKKLAPYFAMLPEKITQDLLSLLKGIKFAPQQQSSSLARTDAVLQAPNTHLIVFESEGIRLLEVLVDPGEEVPFHSHQWDSLMVTIQGSRFKINDGKTICEEDWLLMAEKLEGSLQPLSYQNIGTDVFHAFAFELKF